jgi:hypothetical protein
MPKDFHLPDDVIGMIYESIADEEPWQRPLEKIRTMIDASNLMIRIAGKGARTRDAIFAYGPKVDQTKITDWEDRIYREIFPINPPQGETVFFQWEQVLKKDEFVRYMQSHDSSWTICHCFDGTVDGEFANGGFDCMVPCASLQVVNLMVLRMVASMVVVP